jgi:hypothetical protein
MVELFNRLLGLQTEPEPVRDRRAPLFVLIPPRNLAAAIIVSAGEDQSEGAAIRVSFRRTYFEATGKAHDCKYRNCRTLLISCEEMVFSPIRRPSGSLLPHRNRTKGGTRPPGRVATANAALRLTFTEPVPLASIAFRHGGQVREVDPPHKLGKRCACPTTRLPALTAKRYCRAGALRLPDLW